MNLRPRVAPFHAWFSVLGLGLLLAPACGRAKNDTAPPKASGVFGGTGGVIDAVPVAGQMAAAGGISGSGGSGGAARANDVCANVPLGRLALLDDFNDGDSVAAPEAGREAYWFTVVDDTAGTLVPSGAFFPVAGGPDGSRAAHVSAENFTDWGAALVANISHKEATRCPYNASAFAGLRFVAKGHGNVRAQLSMPGVVDQEFGGACDAKGGEICYDLHGTFISLTEQYRVYELPWSVFLQRGFGKQVPFDPTTIFSLQFSFETPDLPVDFWLDDVAFWDGVPVPLGSGEGGAGGQGGEGGERSQGGANNEGGAAAIAGEGGARAP
jgi:hypothetical protein